MSQWQQYKFIVKKGPNPGHAYPAFANKITIGRDPMSDIIFKDPEVSRRHVQFIRDGNNYFIEDLGSTNGTFIDGERLAGQQIRLQVGQEIALGGAITLIFEEKEDSGLLDSKPLETMDSGAIDGLASFPATAALDDPYAEYRLDEDEYDDFEAYEEELESAHIDQLQSLPPLRDKSVLHTRVLQSSKNQQPDKAVSPPVQSIEGGKNIHESTNHLSCRGNGRYHSCRLWPSIPHLFSNFRQPIS